MLYFDSPTTKMTIKSQERITYVINFFKNKFIITEVLKYGTINVNFTD